LKNRRVGPLDAQRGMQRSDRRNCENRTDLSLDLQPAHGSRIFVLMPRYFFQLRTPNAAQHPARCGEFPNLGAALAEAHGAVRALIHKRARGAPADLYGSLDIEDERREAVARILLADVARQIS
jgi:hypothetical protein